MMNRRRVEFAESGMGQFRFRQKINLNQLYVMVSIFFCLSFSAKLQAQAVFGPTPYTSFSNSPFNSITFSYFHLETFEGGFNAPGVSASAGAIQGPGGLTDSVDVDDGTIDGSGTNGRSFFTTGGQAGIRFTFDAGVLGLLPTHVGIV